MKKTLLLLLMLSPWLRADDAEAPDDTAATVIEMSGQCLYAVEGADLKPVELGQLFADGDRLVTREASSLQLVLADGSTLALGPNSELAISSVGKGGADSKSFFDLVKGSVNAIVQKLKEGAAFEVRTSNAVAAVKGTQFEVSAQEGADSAVTVQEGTVAMSDPGRHATVLVPPMHRAQSSAGGPRPAQRLSRGEAREFRQRWAKARSVHDRREVILKHYEGTRATRVASLHARKAGMRQKQEHRDKAVNSKKPVADKDARDEAREARENFPKKARKKTRLHHKE